MYTVDTSVWINATESAEVDHAASRAFLRESAVRALPIICLLLCWSRLPLPWAECMASGVALALLN